ncbi:MAG: sporulation protein YqfD, partial [Acutalibacteraceae bacterium]
GMKIRCVSKHGLPFFLKRHKDRVGLAVAAVIFVIFMAVTSMFIWNVDVIGCENTDKEEILQIISDLGVHEGTLKKNINTKEITDAAMIKLSGKVSWLAVNIKGTHAVVEVRDYIPEKDDETYGEPCNIIADFDGLILSADVYNGRKACQEGSGAETGDLLISGIVENRDTSAQFMEARGKITALHNVKTETQTSILQSTKRYFTIKKKYKLSLLSIRIPLGFYPKNETDFDTFITEKHLCYGQVKLPFAIITETRAYYKKQNEETKDALAVSFDEYTDETYEKFKNTLVLATDVNISSNRDSVIISSDNKCIDFMGKKQKIMTE